MNCNVIMNSSLTLQILCAIILGCFYSIVLSNTAMTNTAMMMMRNSAKSNKTDRDHSSTSGCLGKKTSRSKAGFDLRAQQGTPVVTEMEEGRVEEGRLSYSV